MALAWRQLDEARDDHSLDIYEKPWGAYPPNLLQKILISITHNTILQRGALRKLMAKVIMSISRPLDIKFRDCNFRIEVRNNLIERGILTRPVYNATEIDFLLESVKNGGAAIDIGCNIGLYSLSLAKAVENNSQIIAIDANPDMLRHLDFNALSSGLENIVTVHAAVGDEEKMVDLKILKDDVAIVRVEENPQGSTKMLPLLRILSDQGISNVACLKIDIEGNEDAAMVPFLQNATEDLLPSRIVIERASKSGDYPGCVAEFKRLGYQLIDRTRNNSMYERKL